MPRRNYRTESRRARPEVVSGKPETPEAMARWLVDRHLASPLILHDDHTHKSLTPSTERKS